MDKIKTWLFEKLAGKIVARASVTIAAALVAGPVADFLAKIGIKLDVSPAEMSAGLIALGHAAYEWYKNRTHQSVPKVPAQ